MGWGWLVGWVKINPQLCSYWGHADVDRRRQAVFWVEITNKCWDPIEGKIYVEQSKQFKRFNEVMSRKVEKNETQRRQVILELQELGEGAEPDYTENIVFHFRNTDRKIIDSSAPYPLPIFMRTDQIKLSRPTMRITHLTEFIVKPRLVLHIIGETGSGKSTMINHLLTLVSQCQNYDKKWMKVETAVNCGSVGAHSTRKIKQYKLGDNLMCFDSWGISPEGNGETWRGWTILDFAKGYIRAGAAMGVTEVNEDQRTALESTRETHEADVVAVTITAQALNEAVTGAGANAARGEKLKTVAGHLRENDIRVLFIITRVDECTKDPDCKSLKYDLDSKKSKKAIEVLTTRAKRFFHVEENDICVCTKQNGDKDTPEQRRHTDYLHFKILEELVTRAVARNKYTDS